MKVIITENRIEQIMSTTSLPPHPNRQPAIANYNYYTIQLQNNEKDKLQRFHVDSYRILRIYICTAAQQLVRFVDSANSGGLDKGLLVKSIKKIASK